MQKICDLKVVGSNPSACKARAGVPLIERRFKAFWMSDLVGWLVVLRINVDLAIFQPYLDLEAGDNQSLKIQVARPGIEPRSSCSASQELNHSATAAPFLMSETPLRDKLGMLKSLVADGVSAWQQLKVLSRDNFTS